MPDLPPVKEFVKHYGLLAKKSLGQHFLLDEKITGDIARAAGRVDDHSIIEVGPGPGGLTRSLLKAGAKHIYAIEKDDRCIAILGEIEKAAPGKLTGFHEDALEFDYESVPVPRKIVANLPYNIATPLLLGWLDMLYHNPKAFTSLTLMFQKEVADRIAAIHGNKDYGRLSVISQFLCEVRMEMVLPPGAFVPPPAVSSAVVTLLPREKPLVDVDKKTLEKVMAAAFGQRRKMLRKALKPLDGDTEALLNQAGIEPTLRAEQVDVVTLCKLAKLYQEL